jgi:hypothetical protein
MVLLWDVLTPTRIFLLLKKLARDTRRRWFHLAEMYLVNSFALWKRAKRLACGVQ